MKKIRLILAIFLALAFYGTNCFADGSVSFDEQVLPIINQRPFFANFLLQTFEFDKNAVAVTIGPNVSEKLGSTRIGPYRVCARLRSAPLSDPCSTQVVIDTDTHFLDKDGKEVDGPEGAQSVRESFYAIEVDPPLNQAPADTSNAIESRGKRN